MKKTVKIGGMSCEHCSSRLSRAILGIPGVISANVNHLTGIAVIDCGMTSRTASYAKPWRTPALIISAEREK